MQDRHYLFLLALGLSFLGLIMIFSASGIHADHRFHDSFFFLKKEIFGMFVGLVALVGVYHFNLNKLRLMAPFLYLGTLSMVLLTYTSLGLKVGGARRWLQLPGFTFQPSEVLKYSLILLFASYFSKVMKKKEPGERELLVCLLLIGLAVLPVLGQPDFGTAVMIAFCGFLMMFVSGIKFRYLFCCVLSAIPCLYFFIVRFPYRLKRVLTFLDPWKDPQGDGFQIIQSFLAIGKGGTLGVGLGESTQKLFYLPEAHTDFIFSILAEELGFVGCAGVIVGFMLLTLISFSIALRSVDPFEHLLAMGCATLLAFQGILNIAVVTGSMPTKGVPLPFISFGGSNLIMNLLAIGVIMNISRNRALTTSRGGASLRGRVAQS